MDDRTIWAAVCTALGALGLEIFRRSGSKADREVDVAAKLREELRKENVDLKAERDSLVSKVRERDEALETLRRLLMDERHEATKRIRLLSETLKHSPEDRVTVLRTLKSGLEKDSHDDEPTD